MIELFRSLLDGLRRTDVYALSAGPTTGYGAIRRRRYTQGFIRQNAHQANPGTMLRSDQEIVSSQPAKPGRNCYFFVGEMPPLLFPVNDLGGGNRKRLPSFLLKRGRNFEGRLIEEIIDRAVMMEIDGGGVIFNRFQDLPADNRKNSGHTEYGSKTVS